MLSTRLTLGIAAALTLIGPAWAAEPEEKMIPITPEMIHNETDVADARTLFDEQKLLGAGARPETTILENNGWQGPSNKLPFHAYVDLGKVREISTVWMFDTNGRGEFIIEYGQPDKWEKVVTTDCPKYRAWVPYEIGVKTRYLRFTKVQNVGMAELAICEKPGAGYGVEAAPVIRARKAAAEAAARAKRIAAALAERKVVDAGGMWGKLTLIDEINCGDPKDPHPVQQAPADASRVETILGRPCRVLPSQGESRYFAYRVGHEKGLEAGKAYLLTVDYPEDKARTIWIVNRGNETARGFATGAALGDVIFTYTNNNLESLDYPLTGQYETWQQLFYLHDRYPGIKGCRGTKYGTRHLTPPDGFDVIIAHPEGRSAPMSAGAAVARIRLFQVDDPGKYSLTLRLPPKGLPTRHLFWREEMADGVVGNVKDASWRGLDERLDWYEYKARLMEFLGMNTYTKDLLEFGSVQGWDAADNDWYWSAQDPGRWRAILKLMTRHGFDILPYYEYAGGVGRKGLGIERRATPLSEKDAYTHITWSEKKRADLTDPDTIEDFKKVLRYTIVRHSDKADFVGAWIRPRVSQLPISFADATLARFNEQTRQAKPVTREMLRNDKALLEQYYAWWLLKRREFCLTMRDYLRSEGIDDAIVFFQAQGGEPGPTMNGFAITTDQPAKWTQALQDPAYAEKRIKILAADQVARDNLYLTDAAADWPGTWGEWEWQHASPRSDPENYRDQEGVALTYPFNRQFTVNTPAGMDAFGTKSGLAMVRHYPLNENTMGKEDGGKLGYFVVDVERAGPLCMAAEASAMANGDPRFVGYLSANSFQRGFPQYARAFNTAFLSLPAIPSKIIPAASNDQVVVRRYDAGEHGTYLAVVNPGFAATGPFTVTLPAKGTVVDAATGEDLTVGDGKLSLDMAPCSLRAIRIGGTTPAQVRKPVPQQPAVPKK